MILSAKQTPQVLKPLVNACSSRPWNAHRWFSAVKVSQASQVVIQKFGGTSLGTPEKLEKVLDIITRFRTKEQNVVSVVSAFSSDTKSEGTTSRLLAAADAAVSNEEFSHYLDRIQDTHLDIVHSMLTTKSIRDDIKRFVNSELDNVRQFCGSLSVIQELSPRSHDLVIGCGERLAAGILAGVLRENGVDSAMVDLSKAFPKGLDTSDRNYSQIAKSTFKPLLTPLLSRGMVPVVTGFFGNVNGGIINSVGRGYTDLTSALCAGSVSAAQLQVWKESDGVFTGNPTKIEAAQLINNVTPGEAAELTHFGNEVLHPFTMACAISDNVPIAILNTFKPDGKGTVISPKFDENSPEFGDRPGKKGVAAVCSKNDIVMLSMTNDGSLEGQKFLARVFSSFAEFNLKADLISTTMNKLSVTLHESTSRERMQKVVGALEEFCECEVEENKAIVSCIGQGMRHNVGIAAQMFECLSKGGISIEMISQGASEINISVVIDEKDQNKAIHCIHDKFLL